MEDIIDAQQRHSVGEDEDDGEGDDVPQISGHLANHQQNGSKDGTHQKCLEDSNRVHRKDGGKSGEHVLLSHRRGDVSLDSVYRGYIDCVDMDEDFVLELNIQPWT